MRSTWGIGRRTQAPGCLWSDGPHSAACSHCFVESPGPWDAASSLSREQFVQVAPEFHLHVVSDLVGPASPAFYGVLFALQRCQEVELFGFVRSGNDEAP